MLKVLKVIASGILLGTAFICIAGLNGLGIPVELVPVIGSSLYVGSKSITRVKG